MSDLKSRAADFLLGPCCISLGDGPILHVIKLCASGKLWDEPELRTKLSAAIRTAQMKAPGPTPPTGPVRHAYFFYKRAAILQEIQEAISDY